MSGMSAISSASMTAIKALSNLNEQLNKIAATTADSSGSGDLTEGLTQLPQLGIAYQANLFVLQKVQDLSRDLILQPRR